MMQSTLQTLIKDWALWPNLCESKPQAKHFTPLKNGLTNENWLLQSSQQKYVLRLNANNAHALHLNRHAEWHIHNCISEHGLCKAYVFRQKNDIYWIRPFMEGDTLKEKIESNDDFLDNNLLEKIAGKFKFLHSIPTSKSWPEINHQKRINHYWQQIFKASGISDTVHTKLKKLKESLSDCTTYSNYSPSLCHMDGNTNNWIIDKNDIYLIDWEYAALANPLWDLAEFCLSCSLNKKQTQFFLQNYGIKNLESFEHAKTQMTYLSLLWFAVQKEISTDSLIIKLENLLPDQQKLNQTS